jgi:putative oxidoreductase
VAWIFWNSAQVKLINWQRTIELFTDEYRVPLLPPEIAAHMALAIELTAPVLLVLGLATRFAVLVLLGMTAVIQTFVYPDAWPTHLQWTAMMLVLLCRGAGVFSLDQLAWRWISPRLTASR